MAAFHSRKMDPLNYCTTIPIVIVDQESSSIELQKKNLFSVLDKVGERNFAVYAVAGPKRTGKSYLCKTILYYLRAKKSGLGLQNGHWFEMSKGKQDFCWRNGSARCTAGINIWSEPIILNHKGQEIAVLLMDTEGSFDDQTNTDQSARIFAWSSLLSSNFIYNIKNDIREDTLQFLESFLQFASLANSQDGRESSMQKLTFAVRDCEFSDYQSGFYDEYNTPRGQDMNFYDKLRPVRGMMCRESQQIRENLHSKIKELGICLFPHPGRELAKDDCEDNLEVEFARVMADFIELTVDNLQLKHICGHTVTGLDFKKHVDEWETLFKGNRLPEMQTVAGAAAKLHNKITMEQALEIYKNEMKLALRDNPEGMDDDSLIFQHNISSVTALSYYEIRNTHGTHFCDDKLSEEIDFALAAFMECNHDRRRVHEERLQFQQQNSELRDHNTQLTEQHERTQEEINNLQNQNRAIMYGVAGVAGVVGAGLLVAAGPAVLAGAPSAIAAAETMAGSAIGKQVLSAAAPVLTSAVVSTLSQMRLSSDNSENTQNMSNVSRRGRKRSTDNDDSDDDDNSKGGVPLRSDE